MDLSPLLEVLGQALIALVMLAAFLSHLSTRP